MDKTYVFYHDDADGHCAGAIYKFHHEQTPEAERTTELIMSTIQYGYDSAKTFPVEEQSVHYVFLDFCPKREDVQMLHDRGHTIVIIDHHKSSEWVKELDTTGKKDPVYIRVYHTLFQSGCELTWDTLMDGKKLPPAVWMTGRWDMWDHKADERIVPFVTGMRLILTDPATEDGYEFWKACFDTLDCLPADAPEEEKAKRMHWDVVMQLINMGQVAQMYRSAIAEDRIDNLHDMVIGGKKFLMLNADLKDSYDFPVYKVTDDYFGYGWYKWSGNLWKFSLRSTGENDLTSIEGVGGHKNAAGFAMFGFQDPSIYLKAAHESN